MLFLCILILGITGQGAEDASGTVLKIGTPNVVKSASILGDSRWVSLPTYPILAEHIWKNVEKPEEYIRKKT